MNAPPPVGAPLTLGLSLKAAAPARLGRNAAYEHIGNIALAVVVGGGWAFGQRGASAAVSAAIVAA